MRSESVMASPENPENHARTASNRSAKASRSPDSLHADVTDEAADGLAPGVGHLDLGVQPGVLGEEPTHEGQLEPVDRAGDLQRSLEPHAAAPEGIAHDQGREVDEDLDHGHEVVVLVGVGLDELEAQGPQLAEQPSTGRALADRADHDLLATQGVDGRTEHRVEAERLAARVDGHRAADLGLEAVDVAEQGVVPDQRGDGPDDPGRPLHRDADHYDVRRPDDRRQRAVVAEVEWIDRVPAGGEGRREPAGHPPRTADHADPARLGAPGRRGPGAGVRGPFLEPVGLVDEQVDELSRVLGGQAEVRGQTRRPIVDGPLASAVEDRPGRRIVGAGPVVAAGGLDFADAADDRQSPGGRVEDRAVDLVERGPQVGESIASAGGLGVTVLGGRIGHGAAW